LMGVKLWKDSVKKRILTVLVQPSEAEEWKWGENWEKKVEEFLFSSISRNEIIQSRVWGSKTGKSAKRFDNLSIMVDFGGKTGLTTEFQFQLRQASFSVCPLRGLSENIVDQLLISNVFKIMGRKHRSHLFTR